MILIVQLQSTKVTNYSGQDVSVEQARLVLNLLYHYSMLPNAILNLWTPKMGLDVEGKLRALDIWKHILGSRGSTGYLTGATSQGAQEDKIRSRAQALTNGFRSDNSNYYLSPATRTAIQMQALWSNNKELCRTQDHYKAQLDANPDLVSSLGGEMTFTSQVLDRLCLENKDRFVERGPEYDDNYGISLNDQWRYICNADTDHTTSMPKYIQTLNPTSKSQVLIYERVYLASYYSGHCDLMQHASLYLQNTPIVDSNKQCQRYYNDSRLHPEIESLLLRGGWSQALQVWRRQHPGVDLTNPDWNISDARLKKAARELLLILACKNPSLIINNGRFPVNAFNSGTRDSIDLPITNYHSSTTGPLSDQHLKYNLAIAIAVNYNTNTPHTRLDNDEHNAKDWIKIYALSNRRDDFERMAQRVKNVELVEGFRGGMELCRDTQQYYEGNRQNLREGRFYQRNEPYGLQQMGCGAEIKYRQSVQQYNRVKTGYRLSQRFALKHQSKLITSLTQTNHSLP